MIWRSCDRVTTTARKFDLLILKMDLGTVFILDGVVFGIVINQYWNVDSSNEWLFNCVEIEIVHVKACSCMELF